MLLASCTEDFRDWADPMHNGDEGVKTVAMSIEKTAAIDYHTLTADSVELFRTTITKEDQADITYDVVLYNADNTDSLTLTADSLCKVTADTLRQAIVKLYGKRPVQRDMKANVSAYINIDGQAVKAVGSTAVAATLATPVIEDSYYICGSINGYSKTDLTYKVTNNGGDVYANPKFSVLIPAPTDANGNRTELKFKLMPASAYENGSADFDKAIAIGPEEGNEEAENGYFTRENASYFTRPATEQAKFYKLDINMDDCYYTITALNFQQYLWMAGDANGWSQQAGDILSSPNFDGVYQGYMYLTQGGFKFCTSSTDWNGTNYGEGFSTDGGAGNIVISEPNGYYEVNVDLGNEKLSLTAISTIGVIGDATAEGWNASTPLTYNRSERCWEGTVTFTDGTFKFRANDGWDINWGGSLTDLQHGADNIAVTAGTYRVKFYPNCPGKAYATLTAATKAAQKAHKARR